MSAAPQLQYYPVKTARSEVADAIISEAVRQCRLHHSKSLRAIVLTGSLAREESTLLVDDDIRRVLGDADFLLVFRRKSAIPSAAELRGMENEITNSLKELGIACPVHLAGVTRRYFRRLPRHIFTYELRSAGKVVMGDEEILGAIPRFNSWEIEREDAWRLLSNRIVEWLEAAALAAPNRQGPDLPMFYATVKLWIDAATSLLVFLRAYEPSYISRSERLSALAQSPLFSNQLSVPLPQFAMGVNLATAWKLIPERAAAERLGWAFCDQARRFAGALWCWEAGQLTGLDAASAPLTFLRSSRPERLRLRGWLRTARQCARLQRPLLWRRWRALSRWGSPRRCVYAVAAECLLRGDDFGPWAKNGLASQLREIRLRQFLPFPDLPLKSEGAEGWRRLVHEMAWNYHQFVERTRA